MRRETLVFSALARTRRARHNSGLAVKAHVLEPVREHIESDQAFVMQG